MDVEDLRRTAMALPAVEEFVHFRFHTAGFSINGRPFAGMEKGGLSAVFSVDQNYSSSLVGADPDRYQEVWRPGKVRSLVGVRATLDRLSADQLNQLVERAWRNKAPKKLATARTTAQVVE